MVQINQLVQGNAANVQSVPAPVGGWNARDSISNMDPMDAVQMTNFFPTASNVTLRGGYTKWATGMTGQVQTVINYSTGTTDKLYAFVGGNIYDVTSSGAVSSPLVTGLTNNKWEHINVTTAAGSYLYIVNGVDKPRLFNGTTWAAIDGSSAIPITGVTTTSLDNISLFKNRVWFIEKNTLKAWYLPTGAVGGAANYIDMSAIAKYGGYLVDLDTWTLDAGYGVDDNLVFVTSNGEVIVWSGTDPASASTWALIGVWKLGSPIGKRCMLKYAGDLLLITYDGLMPLAGSLQSSRLDPRVALSNKIQGAITAATTQYGDSFGWEILYSAKNNALWINVPVAEGQQQQYVMNNITKSWCNFSGWNANCWETFGDDPYFGGDGYVGRAWNSTYIDDVNNIQTNTLQAFNYYGSRGVKKYFTRGRPNLFTNGQPSIFVGMNVDFDTQPATSSLSFSPSSVGLWDGATSKWDTANWGTALSITNNWQGITGIGYCGGVNLISQSQGIQIEWASTDVVFQVGWAGI